MKYIVAALCMLSFYAVSAYSSRSYRSMVERVPTQSVIIKIQEGLVPAFARIRQIDPKLIPSQLQRHTTFLRTNIKKCVFPGNKCTSAQRAILIRTSVNLLALTVAAIGATRSIAATSKKINRVTQAITQEIQGWGLQQVLERLTNIMNNFAIQLTVLEHAIDSRTLTQSQKRFLYQSVLSITSMVVIALTIYTNSAVRAPNIKHPAD